MRRPSEIRLNCARYGMTVMLGRVAVTFPLVCALIFTTTARADQCSVREETSICNATVCGMPLDPCYAEPDELWTLFDDTRGCLHAGGWISGGFTQNGHGNRRSDGNTPLSYNYAADGPVLNQFWFYAEKPRDTECGVVDWGFRVDYVFGTDPLGMQAYGDFGWDYGWNSSSRYGSAIPQLNVEIGTEDLSVLVGYFLAIKGYESNASTANFFYSHNYGFGYGTPNAHTGALVSYAVNDQWQIDASWTMGWDSWWSNYLNASTFMGGITWSATDDTYVSYHLTAGDFGDGTGKDGVESYAGQLYAHVILFEHRLGRSWTYALEHTLGSNTGLGAGNSQWYSLTNYLFWEIADCWSAGARVGWFHDEDGQKVAVNGAGAGSYYETTIGLNWQPHPNLRLRPELRWDWFDGQGRPFDSRNGETGTATSQLTAGLDLVFTF